jgi:hypothetical protein
LGLGLSSIPKKTQTREIGGDSESSVGPEATSVSVS